MASARSKNGSPRAKAAKNGARRKSAAAEWLPTEIASPRSRPAQVTSKPAPGKRRAKRKTGPASPWPKRKPRPAAADGSEADDDRVAALEQRLETMDSRLGELQVELRRLSKPKPAARPKVAKPKVPRQKAAGKPTAKKKHSGAGTRRST